MSDLYGRSGGCSRRKGFTVHLLVCVHMTTWVCYGVMEKTEVYKVNYLEVLSS